MVHTVPEKLLFLIPKSLINRIMWKNWLFFFCFSLRFVVRMDCSMHSEWLELMVYCWHYFGVLHQWSVSILNCVSRVCDYIERDHCCVVWPNMCDRNIWKKQSKKKTRVFRNIFFCMWQETWLISPKANEFTAIVRTMLYAAWRTKGILKVRIYLYLFREFGGFDLDKCCRYGFHVRTCVVKCDTTRTNWVFVLVCVNSCWNLMIDHVNWYFIFY